jgi:hypothetical protein
VAVARDRCLYCGSSLPAELVPPDRTSGDRPPAEGQATTTPVPNRVLLVLALDAADPGEIERGLGLSAYEASQLARRGGFRLHRILAPEQAEAEANRLRGQGLTVEAIPEEETREPPLRAVGGVRKPAVLALRTEEGPLTLHRGELLIVVRGPIARQHQPVYRRRRVDTASLEDGYRVHLHRRSPRRPVEIDSANFEFGVALAVSSRLELDAWVEEIAAGAVQDDAFRRLPPAFGVAEPEPRGPLAAASALSPSRQSPGEDDSVVLDNAAQFRFYSAWRAALERRRRG